MRKTISIPNPKAQFITVRNEKEVGVAIDGESESLTKRGLPTYVSTPYQSPLVRKRLRFSRENVDGTTIRVTGSRLRKSLV